MAGGNGGRPATYRSTTIATGIRTAAQRTPGKVALREGERTLTYRQLVERIDRVSAGARHDLGLVPGDRVMLLALNRLEYIEIVAALRDRRGGPRSTRVNRHRSSGDLR